MLWVLIKMPRRGVSNGYPQHGEAILMSTHNICFYGGLMKIILLLSNHQIPSLSALLSQIILLGLSCGNSYHNHLTVQNGVYCHCLI